MTPAAIRLSRNAGVSAEKEGKAVAVSKQGAVPQTAGAGAPTVLVKTGIGTKTVVGWLEGVTAVVVRLAAVTTGRGPMVVVAAVVVVKDLGCSGWWWCGLRAKIFSCTCCAGEMAG